MKGNVKGRYTHLFMEIIIVLFFLSIVATVIMYIYSLTNKNMIISQYENMAADCSGKFIDSYKSTFDYKKSLTSAFGNGNYNIRDNKVSINLDKDFMVADTGIITCTISVDDDENLADVSNIEIVFTGEDFEDGKEIYSIKATASKSMTAGSGLGGKEQDE